MPKPWPNKQLHCGVKHAVVNEQIEPLPLIPIHHVVILLGPHVSYPIHRHKHMSDENKTGDPLWDLYQWYSHEAHEE